VTSPRKKEAKNGSGISGERGGGLVGVGVSGIQLKSKDQARGTKRGRGKGLRGEKTLGEIGNNLTLHTVTKSSLRLYTSRLKTTAF